MSRTVEINIGRGKVALIDESDFHLVMKYSWRWSPSSKKPDFGYVVATGIKPDGKKGTFSLHRLLLNPPTDKHVDHINGDRLDNRRSNLRLASRSQNMFNARKREGGSSKFKGVFWNSQKNKWAAFISHDRRVKHLGYYDEEPLAALAYDIEAIQSRGEFAMTNYPPQIVRLCIRSDQGLWDRFRTAMKGKFGGIYD